MKEILAAIGNLILSGYLYILAYFAIINIITLILYIADKKKAIKNKWRIPESTLILFAFLGGFIGALIGMFKFRHKTKHAKFLILVPLATVLWCALIIASIVFAL